MPLKARRSAACRVLGAGDVIDFQLCAAHNAVRILKLQDQHVPPLKVHNVAKSRGKQTSAITWDLRWVVVPCANGLMRDQKLALTAALRPPACVCPNHWGTGGGVMRNTSTLPRSVLAP